MLRGVRVQAGVTLRRLAKDLDRAHSTISDFENGRRLPGVEVVEQYEDYFGLARGTLGAQRERARAERLESPRDATLEENLGEAVCPYVGLRAFEADDAALFFGRETQVQEVLGRFAEERFVAVIGASGSGKSSFVRAGLLAHIKMARTAGGGDTRVVLLTPGEHPVQTLAAAISATGPRVPAVLLEDPHDPGRGRRAAGPVDGRLVIVVDQFEELFTLCADESERRRFVDALLVLWNDPSSRVIIALRADFYGRVATYPELAAAVVAHQTLIGPLSRAELRRVIELPAASSGLLLQPGLTDTMLDDLVGEPGALPLLSHALLETWKRRRRLMLTVGAYREAGEVRGAIAQTAEDTLRSLPEGDDKVVRSILLSLTDIGAEAEPTRRRVGRAELIAGVESTRRDRVLRVLADARLVTLDERTVTVAHEALIRHWPRLRGWIEADRAGLLIHRRLTADAREWQALDREPAALYRGARLVTASAWASDSADDLGQLEHDFLSASQAAHQRRTRRLRALALGLATVTLIVAALAVWALDQRSDARRQAANRTSLALASLSNEPLTRRPDVSLALAFEAYREVPLPQARVAVIRAILAVRQSHLRGFRTFPTTLSGGALSPDGRTLALVARDRTVRLWDFASGKQTAVLRGQGSPNMAFSADGNTLASASAGDSVRLWDLPTGRQRAVLHVGPNKLFALALSADGKMLATGGESDTVRLWDVATGTRRGLLRVRAIMVFAIAFSHDGTRLASRAAGDRSVRVWNRATGKQVAVWRETGVGPVAFSPDDRMLAAAKDGSVRLWNLASRRQVAVLQARPGAPGINPVVFKSLAFSSDAKTLAAADLDGIVSIWDAAVPRQPATLHGHRGPQRALAFSPGGKLLASAANDGSAIGLWDSTSRRRLAVLHAPAHALAFSPDGTMLASAGSDSTVRLRNRSTGKQLAALDGDALPHDQLPPPHPGALEGDALSHGQLPPPDPAALDVDALSHGQHPPPIAAVAFNPDGTTLASSSGGTVRLWDISTRTRLAVLRHDESVYSVAFSHNGKMLASTSFDTVSLWNVSTGKRLAVLQGPRGPHIALAFSPDSKTLAVGNGDSSDSSVSLWDPATGRQRSVLYGHTGVLRALAFSDDGTTLASASNDRTVRLWDPATAAPLARLSGHTAAVAAIAFSSDGRSLTSAGTDMKLRVWQDVFWQSQPELRATVCDMLLPGLRRSDWEQYAPGIPYRQSCP